METVLNSPKTILLISGYFWYETAASPEVSWSHTSFPAEPTTPKCFPSSRRRNASRTRWTTAGRDSSTSSRWSSTTSSTGERWTTGWPTTSCPSPSESRSPDPTGRNRQLQGNILFYLLGEYWSITLGIGPLSNNCRCRHAFVDKYFLFSLKRASLRIGLILAWHSLSVALPDFQNMKVLLLFVRLSLR